MEAGIQTSPEVLPGSPLPSFHSPTFLSQAHRAKTAAATTAGDDGTAVGPFAGARSPMVERGAVEWPLDDALSPLADVGVPTMSGGSLIYPARRPCAGGGDGKGDPR